MRLNCDDIDSPVDKDGAVWRGDKNGLTHLNCNSCRMREVWQLENARDIPNDVARFDQSKCQWIALECHWWKSSQFFPVITAGILYCTQWSPIQAPYQPIETSMHMEQDFTKVERQIVHSCWNQLYPEFGLPARANSAMHWPENILEPSSQLEKL